MLNVMYGQMLCEKVVAGIRQRVVWWRLDRTVSRTIQLGPVPKKMQSLSKWKRTIEGGNWLTQVCLEKWPVNILYVCVWELFQSYTKFPEFKSLLLYWVICPVYMFRIVAVTSLIEKKHSETQTLHAGCSKVEPKNFAPLQTPFPGVQDAKI